MSEKARSLDAIGQAMEALNEPVPWTKRWDQQVAKIDVLLEALTVLGGCDQMVSTKRVESAQSREGDERG